MTMMYKILKTQEALDRIIPQTVPSIPNEDVETVLSYFREILDSKILINGKYTEAFEQETARSVGTRCAIAVNSCTSALEAVLEYINVRGREVIVPVNTFIATSNAVIFTGGKPVLVDIGEDLLMDFEALRQAVTGDTKAIILVHLAGLIHPRIEDIRALCRERNIYLLEDAAHAHGASLGGTSAGNFGYAAAFSYYATKVITTGIGGMVTTNDEELAHRVRSIRFHGEDTTRGIQNRLGRDMLITEFQAALGLSQVRRLPFIVKKRMELARKYDAALRSIKGIKLFPLREGAVSGYYKYPIRILPPFRKGDFVGEMEKQGIKTGTAYWPPIHLQPVYREIYGYKEGDYPMAEEVLRSTVSLPLYPDMQKDDIERVIDGVTTALR